MSFLLQTRSFVILYVRHWQLILYHKHEPLLYSILHRSLFDNDCRFIRAHMWTNKTSIKSLQMWYGNIPVYTHLPSKLKDLFCCYLVSTPNLTQRTISSPFLFLIFCENASLRTHFKPTTTSALQTSCCWSLDFPLLKYPTDLYYIIFHPKYIRKKSNNWRQNWLKFYFKN